MFQKINISISDKIAASQNNTSDPNINTNSIPSAVDGSPGDSAIQKPDLNGINSAGPEVAQKQTNAQQETGPQKRSQSIPSDIQYENPQDTEFPTDQDPRTTTPTPKKKGFMESLIEAKATEYMQSKMQTPEADNGTKGKTVDDPNIQKAPDNKRVDRPNPQTWKPQSSKPNDPGMPNQDLLDSSISKGESKPAYNPVKYNSIDFKSPKITPFKPPRFK